MHKYYHQLLDIMVERKLNIAMISKFWKKYNKYYGEELVDIFSSTLFKYAKKEKYPGELNPVIHEVIKYCVWDLVRDGKKILASLDYPIKGKEYFEIDIMATLKILFPKTKKEKLVMMELIIKGHPLADIATIFNCSKQRISLIRVELKNDLIRKGIRCPTRRGNYN